MELEKVNQRGRYANVPIPLSRPHIEALTDTDVCRQVAWNVLEIVEDEKAH